MTRIGLVGTGGMGTVHYTSYGCIDGARVAAVVGVSGRDEERADEWNLPLYRTIPEMLGEQDVDLVDICTPTYLHARQIGEALAGGKSVITEKPLALSSEDAKRIYETAEKSGLQIYVGQVLQFYPESGVLRELVKSGEYGKPLDACFTRLSAAPQWAQGGWLFERDKSGLVPFDLHIHDLDLIVSVFGRPEGFRFTHCGGADKPYPEHYRFHYRYANCNVTAEAGWLNADIPFTAGWRVYFEDAMVANDGGRVTAYQFGRKPRVFDTEEKIKIPTGINVPPTGTFLAELTHFLDCHKNGVPSPKVPKSQVITVLELLEEITE